ncbi:unnamed protein product, partial [Brachionus calyciflorus]
MSFSSTIQSETKSAIKFNKCLDEFANKRVLNMSSCCLNISYKKFKDDIFVEDTSTQNENFFRISQNNLMRTKSEGELNSS